MLGRDEVMDVMFPLSSTIVPLTFECVTDFYEYEVPVVSIMPLYCLDELHMILECPALQAVRQRYAPLFSTDTNSMRTYFAQQDHMQVFKLVLDCLDVFGIHI